MLCLRPVFMWSSPHRFAPCAVLLLLAACSEQARDVPSAAGGSGLDVSSAACPDAAMIAPRNSFDCASVSARSFTRDVMPLFQDCAGELCHAFGPEQILKLVGEPATDCCNEEQMIEPGHPERSYLLQKLVGKNLCSGAPMPLGKGLYPDSDLRVIADWICAGAHATP